MLNTLNIGYPLPKSFGDITVDGLSGGFNENLFLIFKSEDLTSEEIQMFNLNTVTLDILKLDFFKELVGNIYSISIKIDGLIDNSEIYFDFTNENLINYLKRPSSTALKFILIDEKDRVLAFRDFILNRDFINIILKEPCNIDNYKFTPNYVDYIQDAFIKIFKNQPEENLRLYSIGHISL